MSKMRHRKIKLRLILYFCFRQKKSQPIEKLFFIWVCLSQNFEGISGSKISMDCENGSSAYPIPYNQRRSRRKDYMKSIGGRLRRWEKAKQGKSPGLDKKQTRETFLHWWIQDN